MKRKENKMRNVDIEKKSKGFGTFVEEKQKCRYIGEERGTCVKEKKQEGKRIKKKKDGRKLYIYIYIFLFFFKREKSYVRIFL